MNKVILIGNLTRDPELSETPNGIAYCKIGLAVSRAYANEDGERETDFFNLTVWREQAKNCEKYLSKGSKIGIVGSIQIRSYEDKEGNKRTVHEIQVNEVEFLSSARAKDAEEQPHAKRNGKGKAELTPINDDDLPF